MKKFIAVLFAVCLLPYCVFAETDAYSLDQSISIPVTLVFDQSDGTTQNVLLDFNAYTLSWNFQLSRNSKTGDYNGFSFDLERLFSFSPAVAEISSMPLAHLVEASITTLKVPDKKITFSPIDGSCEVQFYGGSYELNYTSALHFSANGELIGIEQNTVKQAFHFSEQFEAHKQ